jgi:hypothetical protein
MVLSYSLDVGHVPLHILINYVWIFKFDQFD